MTAMVATIHHGTWQVALEGVTANVLISDPPYSSRTHFGHDAVAGKRPDGVVGQALHYDCWDANDVKEFVQAWHPRVSGWFVVMTDHLLVPAYERELQAVGRYVFAPLPFVAPGSRVRLQGDGPSSWTTWIVVARPRNLEFARWGTLPGAYILPSGMGGKKKKTQVQGAKPLWLMRSLVRHYSRHRDLIVDPCAGGGTTLVAATFEGRKSIGAEQNDAVHRVATEQLARPVNLMLNFE